MTFDEHCYEVVVERVYVALINAKLVEVSGDGYQQAREAARRFMDLDAVGVHGWLRADGSFSEQIPDQDGQSLLLKIVDPS